MATLSYTATIPAALAAGEYLIRVRGSRLMSHFIGVVNGICTALSLAIVFLQNIFLSV